MKTSGASNLLRIVKSGDERAIVEKIVFSTCDSVLAWARKASRYALFLSNRTKLTYLCRLEAKFGNTTSHDDWTPFFTFQHFQSTYNIEALEAGPQTAVAGQV